jgi:predicted SnoaL-like aldol condensation-catalyzing enzyme
MQEATLQIGIVEVDVARMRRFLALYEHAWAQPRTGELAELWAPDAQMMHPELEEPIRGRDAVMSYLNRFLEIAPDLTVRPLAAAANGDTLFIHFRSQATIAGETLVWEGVDRYDLDGEKGVYGIGFFDTTAIRRALAGEPRALTEPSPPTR